MTREEREDAINFFKEVAEREVNNAKYSKLAIEALEQSTQEVLETLRQEICDIRSTHLDSQEFALVRKSDVLNIIDKHLLEVNE